MNYNTAWTISSVSKLVTEAITKTGKGGVFILVGGIIAGGYLGFKKLRELDYRVRELEYQVKFGGK